MRQVQLRGCLPALFTLILLGALLALVVSASLAVALPVAGALLALGLVRALWYRLTGRRPAPPPQVATFRTMRVDRWGIDTSAPGPAEGEGPVVDALPRPRREKPPANE